jgi:hypothetical protein
MIRSFQLTSALAAALLITASAQADTGEGTVADPAKVRSPVALSAVSDSAGHAAFAFEGKGSAPTAV